MRELKQKFEKPTLMYVYDFEGEIPLTRVVLGKDLDNYYIAANRVNTIADYEDTINKYLTIGLVPWRYAKPIVCETYQIF